MQSILRSSNRLALAGKPLRPLVFLALARGLSAKPRIIYTYTDEAPMLATYSLLPIVKTLTAKAGIEVEKVDISLAGRIISSWPKYLTDEQRQGDGLAELGELCKTKDANIIKLPNVSASIPQLNEAITELRTQGFDVPMYVAKPTTDKEKVIHERYAKVLGSAVNPVLREGNSDRRVAPPVKNYAKKNPHTLGGWSRASRSHVAHMDKGDFYGSEKSHTMAAAGTVRIEHVGADGTVKVMKEGLKLQAGEIIDASFLSVRELRKFFTDEIDSAIKDHMLLSLHLKATMMKISDPVIFGHAVSVYFKDLFDKYVANASRPHFLSSRLSPSPRPPSFSCLSPHFTPSTSPFSLTHIPPLSTLSPAKGTSTRCSRRSGSTPTTVCKTSTTR
jgi:isocitrate dehydrogenase